jgi:hypothetical protein
VVELVDIGALVLVGIAEIEPVESIVVEEVFEKDTFGLQEP